LTKDFTRFLHKAQRSLTYETLHLSSPECGVLAHILVEFAEDLYQDLGIWRSLEHYNLDFFGTRLPCVLQPDEPMDADPVNPARIQFLHWTLYSELQPELILSWYERHAGYFRVVSVHEQLMDVQNIVNEHPIRSESARTLVRSRRIGCDDGIGVYR
jgi:hypothetical protein